ncbi:glycosyltransferase [uncultured Thalassospira sp.]|uniref:glycosyltransferase n=1 Tax=uncultured Thalassospira sp. TaxID=404382 RepID=UPI0032B25EFC|tara:strand:- start:6153 stop:7244 length:1092 start_codon:yes stop_codon:yes gene_type:complete
MRILFLIRSLETGGAERQLLLLAKGLAGAGCTVQILTFYNSSSKFNASDYGDVKITSLEKTGRWGLGRFLFRLLKEVRIFSPDIIHGYLPTGNLLALIAKAVGLFRPRVVFGIRASTMDLTKFDWLAKLTYTAEKKLSVFADAIIANSEAGALSFRRYNKQIHVIPNGIDTEKFAPNTDARNRIRKAWALPPDSYVIGMVARVDPMKDHQTFISAAGSLSKDFSTMRFVCIGAGDMSELEAECSRRKILDKFIFCGSKDNMEDYYNALDLVVLPSFGEGFPNVVAEAMSVGKPVVASNVGAVREIVGSTGIVIDVGSSDQLATACAKMKNAGNREVEIRAVVMSRFTAAKLVDRTLGVFRFLI